MTTHAILSPSSAHRWMKCPASVALESDYPETSSEFADEGTAAHDVAARALINGVEAAAFLDTVVTVGGKGYPVTTEMAEHVQKYLDYVNALKADSIMSAVEVRLPIGDITGEEGAEGTSDTITITNDGELVIVDLKYGMGVKVDAECNPQLSLYALGALELYGLSYDIRKVRLVIVQPRLNHISEWACDLDGYVSFFRDNVADCAALCRDALRGYESTNGVSVNLFNPGDDQCRFCKAKGNCPALTKHALETVSNGFSDLTKPPTPDTLRPFAGSELGPLLSSVDLIEGWCQALREHCKGELLAGRSIPGWKVVEGRRGVRRWADAREVESIMKGMRLKQDVMYEQSLISPATAEKLVKAGDIGPRQWPRLQQLITQSGGSPTVVPESDKRPALSVANDFESLV